MKLQIERRYRDIRIILTIPWRRKRREVTEEARRRMSAAQRRRYHKENR